MLFLNKDSDGWLVFISIQLFFKPKVLLTYILTYNTCRYLYQDIWCKNIQRTSIAIPTILFS